LFRLVEDNEAIFPQKHKKELTVSDLPDSLKNALYSFVLVCAARRARGETEVHNSMLVHVTRFVDVQHQVAQLIQHQVESIRRRLVMGEGERSKTLISELAQIWKRDFEQTSVAISAMVSDENLPEVTWQQVQAELPEAAARIEVKEINGHATDALDYVMHRQGFNVVAVGGDKLSRGLTLEGLSVSYFLRASQMYDTLMQMGRWFGYRPGYLDLCRLYTTEDLRRWYRHIALAEVELRREFDRMKTAGLTPRNYGLRVREHPGGLLVTAMNKMAHARTQSLSYAGQLVQTAHFLTNEKIVQDNVNVVSNFLDGIGGQKKAKNNKDNAWKWMNVTHAQLLDSLLNNFSVAPECWRLQKPEMIAFIRKQADAGELTKWTVALIDTAGKAGSFPISDCNPGIAERAPEEKTWELETPPSVYATRNANIQSPSHQALDLEEMDLNAATLSELLSKRVVKDGPPLFSTEEAELLRRCCEEGRKLDAAAEMLSSLRKPRVDGESKRTRINGEVARQLRPSTHGLLLIYPVIPTKLESGEKRWLAKEPFIGLAFSFPSSHTARAVDYRVNRVWQANFRDEDYED